ncbi:putative Chaperone protein DnaJ [Glarea lozoyensis 74030]|uniref:Putative Chaperone protein DnaJ n=1 Tax=Glarea lozoyensis (strain ATCC 74030 / MF5533) TaxID=1104152 RepID=H0EPS2_GLAL7|nr:putative Chaperone protein DnaJ [Glarea lozoyensis 74030]
MDPETDYYELLGLLQSASLKDIDTAYKKASLRHHPDRNLNSPTAHEEFITTNEYRSKAMGNFRGRWTKRLKTFTHREGQTRAFNLPGRGTRCVSEEYIKTLIILDSSRQRIIRKLHPSQRQTHLNEVQRDFEKSNHELRQKACKEVLELLALLPRSKGNWTYRDAETLAGFEEVDGVSVL